MQVGAWTSSNITNPSKRAAAIGLLMLFGSVGGGSIGSNIYISSEVSWSKNLKSRVWLTSPRRLPILSDLASQSAQLCLEP